jgi:hypothetical protein
VFTEANEENKGILAATWSAKENMAERQSTGIIQQFSRIGHFDSAHNNTSS